MPNASGNRFDYVEYDKDAMKLQLAFKNDFMTLETLVDKGLEDGRAKSLVLTKLEEAYMWVGKSIRDSQIKRNPQTRQQESRGNK